MWKNTLLVKRWTARNQSSDLDVHSDVTPTSEGKYVPASGDILDGKRLDGEETQAIGEDHSPCGNNGATMREVEWKEQDACETKKNVSLVTNGSLKVSSLEDTINDKKSCEGPLPPEKQTVQSNENQAIQDETDFVNFDISLLTELDDWSQELETCDDKVAISSAEHLRNYDTAVNADGGENMSQQNQDKMTDDCTNGNKRPVRCGGDKSNLSNEVDDSKQSQTKTCSRQESTADLQSNQVNLAVDINTSSSSNVSQCDFQEVLYDKETTRISCSESPSKERESMRGVNDVIIQQNNENMVANSSCSTSNQAGKATTLNQVNMSCSEVKQTERETNLQDYQNPLDNLLNVCTKIQPDGSTNIWQGSLCNGNNQAGNITSSGNEKMENTEDDQFEVSGNKDQVVDSKDNQDVVDNLFNNDKTGNIEGDHLQETDNTKLGQFEESHNKNHQYAKFKDKHNVVDNLLNSVYSQGSTATSVDTLDIPLSSDQTLALAAKLDSKLSEILSDDDGGISDRWMFDTEMVLPYVVNQDGRVPDSPVLQDHVRVVQNDDLSVPEGSGNNVHQYESATTGVSRVSSPLSRDVVSSENYAFPGLPVIHRNERCEHRDERLQCVPDFPHDAPTSSVLRDGCNQDERQHFHQDFLHNVQLPSKTDELLPRLQGITSQSQDIGYQGHHQVHSGSPSVLQGVEAHHQDTRYQDYHQLLSSPQKEVFGSRSHMFPQTSTSQYPTGLYVSVHLRTPSFHTESVKNASDHLRTPSFHTKNDYNKPRDTAELELPDGMFQDNGQTSWNHPRQWTSWKVSRQCTAWRSTQTRGTCSAENSRLDFENR